MNDPTVGHVDLEQIEVDEHREKIRNRIIIGLILLIGLGAAIAVGFLISSSQQDEQTAQDRTEQAQVEKFNLAQQIAIACKDPANGLDEDTARRLCADAATIVREGPQGAQGIPGVQGVQGIPGTDGRNGKDSTVPGPKGDSVKDGKDGKDGADSTVPGPGGNDGTDGTDGTNGTNGTDGKDAVPFEFRVTINQKDYRCQIPVERVGFCTEVPPKLVPAG